MELITVFVLGLVEGLTEFIPVSSTGHLILMANWLNFTGPKAASFEIFIQLGAILAVIVLYFSRFLAFLDFSGGGSSQSLFSQEYGFRGLRGLLKLGLACLPAFVCGFLFHRWIKENLFSPNSVLWALIVWGFVMVVVEIRGIAPRIRKIEELSYRHCLIIGLFQCLSLWPGVSRSGSTIVGALLLKVERSQAAEFSFILAVPVMFAAALYDLMKSIDLLTFADLKLFALGFATSFVTAMLALRFFMMLLRRWTLAPFGIYRIVVGVIGLCLIFLTK